MKTRIAKGALFFLLLLGSILLLLSFEYFKVNNLDHRPYFYALMSALCLMLAVRTRFSLSISIISTALFALFYSGVLQWKSLDALPELVGSKTRCEGGVYPYLMTFSQELLPELGRGTCLLQFLKARVLNLPPEKSEVLLFRAPGLLVEASEYSDTALVILLSYWHEVHDKEIRLNSSNENSKLHSLKDAIDLLEGDLNLLQAYSLQSFWAGKLGARVESLRVKKVIEIATLAKLSRVLFEQMQKNALEFDELHLLPASELGPGQLTLLEIRADRTSKRFTQMVKAWDLKKQLTELNIEDTYPDASREIFKNILSF